MNIKILDSWLREYLKTEASVKQISETLSLTSVSVERVEKFEKTSSSSQVASATSRMTPGTVEQEDYIYDIEVTTNRPDLMSVIGLARETTATLSQSNIQTSFKSPELSKFQEIIPEPLYITIHNDPSIVNRITAIIMEVKLKDSPPYIRERLEASGIRSLNNIIDVTNYVMRETGHPTHVFDYDRLTTKKIIIRESKKGEKIQTLDGKEHKLPGGDIIADNGKGEIIDLLGIMGTANSVVTENTKRILFFIDNLEPHHVRNTSMTLGIRSEAAVINEKSVDPELAMTALLRGIKLFEEIADARILSEIIDIYPNKPQTKIVTVTQKKINEVIGIKVPEGKTKEILDLLGFEVKASDTVLEITIPSWRVNDIEIEEDIIEEIARVYGYHKLPDILPPLNNDSSYSLENDEFYWERKAKSALKYWGFTEVYTYSMVPEDLLEGPTDEAMALSNPLSEDMVYMRKSIVPSLLQVIKENPSYEEIKIFELANIYLPRKDNLPDEVLTLAGVIKKSSISFFEAKGIIEQFLTDLGIRLSSYQHRENGGLGASIHIEKDYLGDIEVLDKDTVDFELNFKTLLKHVSLRKIFKPVAKFPPVIEDVRLLVNPDISYEDIIKLIKGSSPLVTNVSLLDIYENKKTFRIYYQDPDKNLTNEEVAVERDKVYKLLEKEIGAEIV